MLLVAVISIQSADVGACVRREKFKRFPGDPSSFLYHGPVTYGELDRTVTLDCLSYVGSIEKNGKEHVLIEDETGKVHVLTVGDTMGWYRSFIIKIDTDFIYLKQLVNLVESDYLVEFDSDAASEAEIEKYNEHIFREMTVKFPKRPKHR
jgi:hypothetical protein